MLWPCLTQTRYQRLLYDCLMAKSFASNCLRQTGPQSSDTKSSLLQKMLWPCLSQTRCQRPLYDCLMAQSFANTLSVTDKVHSPQIQKVSFCRKCCGLVCLRQGVKDLCMIASWPKVSPIPCLLQEKAWRRFINAICSFEFLDGCFEISHGDFS
jgi:dissimilatory sulfite reductase (desulfoviridin) alpha/beta subunit